MAIQLGKGSRINLQKEVPSLTKVRIGLGWKPQEFDNSADFDLDVTAFGLKIDAAGNPVLAGRKTDPDFMVFYGNLQSIDGAITHTGDNKTGEGDGDDETITVDLSLLSNEVDEISFIVTIHEATERGQNFGQIPKSWIAVYDDATGKEIGRYDLGEDFSSETAVQMGSLYRREDGKWGFKAVGAGYNLGLAAFVKGYGGEVA